VRARTWALLGAVSLTFPHPVHGQNVGAPSNFGELELEESFVPDPRSVSVTSGGRVGVSVGSCDYGYVSEAPDVDLHYGTSGTADLYLYVQGEGDTMLLVNAPDGSWWCDDDSLGRLDPVLHFPAAPSGLYSVWVGSFSQEYLDATLYVSEIDPGLPAVEGEPDLSLQPTYGEVELEEGFLPDPHEVVLTAGGDVRVRAGDCDYGYVDYETSGETDLFVYVESPGDVTLLMNRPDGSWVCDDDGYGDRNPIVAIPAAPGGLYDIWVGTWGDELQDAILYISELDPR